MHNTSFTRGDPTPPYTDATRAPLLIGMTAGFLGIALIFVALRVYVRAVVLKKWGLDDTLLVVAYVSTHVLSARLTILEHWKR